MLSLQERAPIIYSVADKYADN